MTKDTILGLRDAPPMQDANTASPSGTGRSPVSRLQPWTVHSHPRGGIRTNVKHKRRRRDGWGWRWLPFWP